MQGKRREKRKEEGKGGGKKNVVGNINWLKPISSFPFPFVRSTLIRLYI